MSPTTINYPGYEMGEVTARNLINHLKENATINAASTIMFRPEIILRESSQKKKTQ